MISVHTWHVEMIAAGERLLEAQREEEACSEAHARLRSSKSRSEWIRARALVDACARDYQGVRRVFREFEN
jgi:hypothetical protein